MSKITEHVGKLVGTDKLKEAIFYLRDVLKNSPQLDEVLLQSGRLTEVMKQIRLGTMSTEDANIGKNKIRLALIEFVREIDEITDHNPEILKDSFLTKTSISIIQNHSGTGDNIGGNKNINSIRNKN